MRESTGQIAIYRTEDSRVQLEVAMEQNTVRLSQAQMVELSGRDQSVVSRHIRNALSEGEVVEKSNIQKMDIANSDRPVASYDLDVVISVGYRIKSERGVQFRRWATNVLHQHLVQGYTLSQQRLEAQGILSILEKYSHALTVLHKSATAKGFLAVQTESKRQVEMIAGELAA